MKTISNGEAKRRKRTLWLSLLCAGVVATFLGGCATAYYTPDYDYYTYSGYPYYYRYGATRYYYRPGTRYYTTDYY